MSGPVFHVGERPRITLIQLFVFFCFLLGVTAILVHSDVGDNIDLLLHDSWVRTNSYPVPDDVVIASIDEASLLAVGRWPWSRDRIAELVDRLADYGIRALIIDIAFTEESPFPDHDKLLADALARLPLSILPVHTEAYADTLTRSLAVPTISRMVSNYGHTDLPIDKDGIVRRVALSGGVGQPHWYSLSLAALQSLDQLPRSLPGDRTVKTAERDRWVYDHEVMIPFYGKSGIFDRVSAINIINGDVEANALHDKFVFLGLTSEGLEDRVPTPVSAEDSRMPGVEVHVNIFSALRDGRLVEEVNPAWNYPLALVLLLTVLFIYSRWSPSSGLGVAVIATLVPVVLSLFMYRYMRLWFAPMASSTPVLISYLIWSWHRLRYVNNFLESEQSKLDDSGYRRRPGDDQALVAFFETGQRHLPIKAWRFSNGKALYSGGQGLPERRVPGGDDAWALRQGVFARRYPGRQSMHLEFLVDNADEGVEIAELIDSLSRIRAREQVSVFTDTLERLQTNTQLLSTQLDWLRGVKAFADTVLAGSPVGFVVWNGAGECVRANELVNSLVPEYPSYGELQVFLQTIEVGGYQELVHKLTSTDPWQVTYRRLEKEVVISFRMVGNRLANRLICASLMDVSDIRTSERARAEMVEYLSHDLRSPLISALYLLDKDDDPQIARNINTSLTMMDNLLHVARADNLTEAAFKSVLLNAVLDNTLDQLLPQALNRNIRFNVNTADDELWIIGDAASLERAFTNIVGNAIKYSPENTTIRIRLDQLGNRAELIVEDQGVGIDPAMLGTLFTRFKRDESVAGQFKGIGLGLALVSRVVSLHGGTVMASNTGDGTRITLQLPLEANTDQNAADAV